MEIELKTRLHITYKNPDHKRQSEILAKLVDKKLKEDYKYQKRINDILTEIGQECISEMY